MKKTIHIIAPIPAPSKRTRIKKQEQALNELGFDIAFYGWERINGESAELQKNERDEIRKNRDILLSGGGYGGKVTLLYYPLWAMCVFWKVLFLPKNACIFCLGFETTAPALIASLFTKRKIIFDDADRLSMLFSFPWPIKWLLQKAEKWASHRATAHLIPGRTRYDWSHEKMIILRNTPSTKDFKTATDLDLAQLFPAISPETDFIIYANGWVGETRGSPILLDLMERLQSLKGIFRLLLIGRGEGTAFEKLIQRDDVIFYPEMPQKDALSAYRLADLLFTYYDPKVPINRQAESNKWGDAVYFGTPFVVNKEVETAGKFIEGGGAFSCAYHDVEALAEMICRLYEDKHLLQEAGKKLQHFAEDYKPYDKALSAILASITAIESTNDNQESK